MRTSLLLVPLALVVVVSALIALRAPVLWYAPSGAVDVGRAEVYWKSMIRVLGSSSAESEMEREGATLPSFDAHVLAHSFGAALYEIYGDEGFSRCTTAFAYGCFHELSGLAIAREGSSALDAFASACASLAVDDRFGCMHGVGHGIIADLGYTFSDLEKGLAQCHALDPRVTRDGCTDGAVMEYQLRIMADGIGNLDPRPFDPEEPFSPCDEVPKADRYACLFETPAWWLSALPERSGAARLTKFGELCGMLSGEDRRACMEGSGFWLASALDFRVDAIHAACGTVAGNAPADTLSCLASAARRFRSMHRSDTDIACSRFALTDRALAYCEAFAHSSPLDDANLARPL